jgi:hypothetical protein
MSQDYMELAEQAAQFERDEHYQRAHKLWLLAAEATASEVNRIWAINRADFCSKPRPYRIV